MGNYNFLKPRSTNGMATMIAAQFRGRRSRKKVIEDMVTSIPASGMFSTPVKVLEPTTRAMIDQAIERKRQRGLT